MKSVLRLPAVAGRFYPDDPEELKRQISALTSAAHGTTAPAIACVVPHAGYRYSGPIAGTVYARLELPKRLVLIGPRHFPRGKPQAIVSQGAWNTPLGRAQIDEELAAEIKAASPLLCEDALAHESEHALEVQLPFLQYLSGEIRFVPIALGPTDYARLESLGRSIAEVLRRHAEPVLLIASSDMNHYESDEITRRKDGCALERLLALDAHGLLDVVSRQRITMCGVGPVVSTLIAARILGAARATLIRYATSAEVSGDRDQVVGYAGVIID